MARRLPASPALHPCDASCTPRWAPSVCGRPAPPTRWCPSRLPTFVNATPQRPAHGQHRLPAAGGLQSNEGQPLDGSIDAVIAQPFSLAKEHLQQPAALCEF